MKSQKERGFTLIELTLVLGVSVLVATALIGMFEAHVQMLTQAAKFKFLAQDAPFIGLILTRTIGNAEDYRIYTTGAIARSATGTPALTLTGSAVKLWMRQPNSTFRQAVVSFETVSGQAGLYFFLANSSTGVFSATPSWEIAGSSSVSLSAATFYIDQTTATTGVMLVKLLGSYNDWYQFAAEKK